MSIPKFVTQQELADFLGCGIATIQRKQRSGILPKSRTKIGVPFSEAVTAFYAEKFENQSRRDDRPSLEDEVGTSLEAEKLRLTSAQADAQELKNEQTRRDVVPYAFLTFVLANVSPEVGSILKTLPLNMRRLHPEIPEPAMATLDREVARAANTISRVDERLEDRIIDYIRDNPA
ncbi:terminase small subunit [Ferrimonas balearica]|uniref:terminase small subunit n=1 Tax=Ferrimonas balearica TaxID=44012 RepID=UPI001C996EA5|nr:terminase small subunit [Ferrimonas balearica]MBY5992506.1 terminase small subunit [Ferrimonas balearica]